MKQFAYLGSLCSTLLIIGTIANAQGDAMTPHRFPPLIPLHELELTSEQESAVGEIFTVYQSQFSEAAQALDLVRQVLETLERSGTATEADLREAAAEVGDKLGDFSVVKASIIVEISSILTAEQKTTLAELKTTRTRHFGHPKF